MKKGTIIKFFTALVLVFALCACGNKIDKVDSALQGRWMEYITDAKDMGAYFEFNNGRIQVGLFMDGEFMQINEGSYEITEEQIIVTYDYTIKGDYSKVPNTEPGPYIDYTYEGGNLSIVLDDNVLEKQ